MWLRVNEIKILVTLAIVATIVFFTYVCIFMSILHIHPLGTVLIHLPSWSKCYGLPISTNASLNCLSGDIDGWSIVHLGLYFLIGQIVPNQYITILGASLMWELYEYYIGIRARWWQDPLINLVGYALGSSLSVSKKNVRAVKYIIVKLVSDNMTFSYIIIAYILCIYFGGGFIKKHIESHNISLQ
jgi:hypothetical protein